MPQLMSMSGYNNMNVYNNNNNMPVMMPHSNASNPSPYQPNPYNYYYPSNNNNFLYNNNPNNAIMMTSSPSTEIVVLNPSPHDASVKVENNIVIGETSTELPLDEESGSPLINDEAN